MCLCCLCAPLHFYAFPKEARNLVRKVSEEERLQREKIQEKEKEKEKLKEREEEKEKLSREAREREEKEREELERKQREETKVREPKSLPKKRQSKLPAPPRHSSAVKVELIEDDKDQVGQVAQVTGSGVGAVSTPAGDAARDPRTRPSRSHDPRLQDHEDAETTVKVFVDPYLENPHPDPEPDTALSVEVLRQPLAVPKRQRRAAPKKAVAKHPPSTPSLPLTPLTPALPSEEKLLEIKQLLQRETQPLTGSQPLPGLPAPPTSRKLPAPTPEPQDSHAIDSCFEH
eukprot:Skav228234  [mRNA]  locus=scaffold3112:46147:47154:+ [translate_table: standard]